MTPAWLGRIQRGTLILLALLYSAGYAVPALLLVFLSVLIEAALTRRVPWRPTPLDAWLLAFIAAFLLSGWLSPHQPVAVGSIGLGALTIYLAFVPLSGILEHDRGFLRPLLGAWVAGGVAAAVWSIALYRQTGHPAFTPALGQNAVGTTLLVSLIFSVGLLLGSGRWRVLFAGAAVPLVIGLAFTFTRGAWLGAAAGLAALFAVTSVRRSWPVFAILTVILLLAPVVGRPDGLSLRARLLSIGRIEANQDRIRVLRVGAAIFRDHPLIGTGLNTFSLVYPAYSPDDRFGVTQPFAHNIFLNMAAEGGVLGFVTFAGAMGWVLLAGWRWHRAAPERAVSAAVLAGFVGAMVHQLFDGTLISVHLGVGLWLIVAVLACGERPTAAST